MTCTCTHTLRRISLIPWKVVELKRAWPSWYPPHYWLSNPTKYEFLSLSLTNALLLPFSFFFSFFFCFPLPAHCFPLLPSPLIFLFFHTLPIDVSLSLFTFFLYTSSYAFFPHLSLLQNRHCFIYFLGIAFQAFFFLPSPHNFYLILASIPQNYALQVELLVTSVFYIYVLSFLIPSHRGCSHQEFHIIISPFSSRITSFSSEDSLSQSPPVPFLSHLLPHNSCSIEASSNSL